MLSKQKISVYKKKQRKAKHYKIAQRFWLNCVYFMQMTATSYIVTTSLLLHRIYFYILHWKQTK